MSFYFGIFNRDIPGYTQVTDSMISFKSVNQNVHISSGLTYHPFAPHKQLFEDGFKYALDSCFEFSDEITIELLGSDVTKQTSIEEVKKQFAGFETRLLADYDIGNEDDGLILKKGPRKVQLKYKEPNSKVYDQGLYKKTLESSGLLQKYSEVMGEKTYPPICTSTLNHNFIVVEPDGGIKTCVSFDGMHTQAQVNLFKDGYSGVLEWLENRFHQQRDEIINRLPDIVYRRHSMCDCR